MNRHTKSGTARASLICAAATALCLSGPAFGADAKPFRIGLMLPISGPGAGGSADGAQQGVRLALHEINSRKLSPRSFEVVVVDDASDPRTAGDVCNRLVLRDKVDAIISQGPTSTRMACNQAAQRAGVPHLAALSGPGGMCLPNLFMVGPETSQTMATLIKQSIRDGNKRLFYLGTDLSVVRNDLGFARKTAETAGGEIIGSAFLPLGTTDFSTDIAKISAQRPDGVIMMLIGADAVTFARQFGSDDRVASIKRADFLMTEKTLRSLGPAGNNIYSVASYYATIPGDANATFKASLTRMFGEQATPDTWAAMTYTAAHMLAKAVKTPESGSKDVLEALPGIGFDGPQGTVRITGKYVTTPIFVVKTSGDGGISLVASYGDVPPAPHCN
jgi:ABC-type branched-subunit amino acid transport system substrate-binding protein